jgi:hypothetical protein
MKKLLPIALCLHAAGFIAVAAAHAAGSIAFDVLTPAGIAGALLVAAVLAFACGDYRRKPSFRARRSAETAALSDDPRPDVPRPDWTYTTRMK